MNNMEQMNRNKLVEELVRQQIDCLRELVRHYADGVKRIDDNIVHLTYIIKVIQKKCPEYSIYDEIEEMQNVMNRHKYFPERAMEIFYNSIRNLSYTINREYPEYNIDQVIYNSLEYFCPQEVCDRMKTILKINK